MTTTPQDDLIGTRTASEILGIHPATLNRWAAAGTVQPAHTITGLRGANVYRRQDIETLAQNRARVAS